MATALLIIDMQNHILHGLATPGRQALHEQSLNAVTHRLAALRQLAYADGAPVILIQHDGEAQHRLATYTEGWKMRPELTPTEKDIVVHKRSCDAFYQTDLLEQLRRLAATRLVIGGCMTQFCLDTTVRRAVSQGYDVTLAADCHTTADSDVLNFEQIIAHHNALLDGFNAGEYKVDVRPAGDVRFARENH